MKKYQALLAGLLAGSVLLAGCGPKPNPDLQVRQAVAQTLAAIPRPTSAPLPTPFPSPTPFSLSGLFCEYRFCIGHPQDMAFFDVSAQQNPGAPSAYAQGILAAYTASLFIQVMWQVSPGTTDPGFLADLILEDGIDTTAGSLNARSIGSITALYTPITTTISPTLPYGGVAAWTCGERVFAWKSYTPDSATAESLFTDAVSRFLCQ